MDTNRLSFQQVHLASVQNSKFGSNSKEPSVRTFSCQMLKQQSQKYLHQCKLKKLSRKQRKQTCCYSNRNSLEKIFSCLTTILILILSLKTTITHADDQEKCQPTGSFFCNINNYSTVQPFKNLLGYTNIESARSDLHRFQFLADHCGGDLKLFLCSLYLPVCVSQPDAPTRSLPPCRDLCEAAKACHKRHNHALDTDWQPQWDCNNFKSSQEDGLCVINNTGRDNSSTIDEGTFGSPTNQTAQPSENNLSCHPLFDCRFPDKKHPFCIESKYVCDGKVDCFKNDSMHEIYEGLDEKDCPPRCLKDELMCEDKCVKNEDICNGRLDCSSGIDEQNCYSWHEMTNLLLTLLCLITFIITCTVIIIKWRWNSDSDESLETSYSKSNFERSSSDENDVNSFTRAHCRTLAQSARESLQEPTYQEPCLLVKGTHGQLNINVFPAASLRVKRAPNDIQRDFGNGLNVLEQSSIHRTGSLHHNLQLGSAPSLDHVNPYGMNCGTPHVQDQYSHHSKSQNGGVDEFMYQAPSVLEKGDYERLNAGGYSGASSVYGGFSLTYGPTSITSGTTRVILEEPPAAPPPTPVPIVQSLYVNAHLKD